MKREFFFIEDEADWPQHLVDEIKNNRERREEHRELFEFTEQLLNTTEDKDKKELSEKSDVLAPYNSTISIDNKNPGQEFLKFIDPNVELVKHQYQYIHFARKVKKANKIFERNHNKAIDLGVQIGIGNSENGKVSPLKELDSENLFSIPPLQNYSLSKFKIEPQTTEYNRANKDFLRDINMNIKKQT
jgi:hypothetical protein